MDMVVRALVLYGFLLIVFRIAGRRTLAEVTTFDLVLILIIGEATQQALLGQDYSLTRAMVVIATLVAADILLPLIKQWLPAVDLVLDGTPTIVVENGVALRDRMRKARIDEEDVLESARRLRGVTRLSDIRYAVLERGGAISIIPARADDKGRADEAKA